MAVSCNKESGSDGGKSYGNKAGGQGTATATTWVMGAATRLARVCFWSPVTDELL
jgi:hypothetical protein